MGLGTIDPAAKLHVNSGIARETFRLYGDGNTSNYMSFWQGTAGTVIDPIGTGQLWIGYDQPTQFLIGVNADGSTSSGSLGIGTNSTGSHKLAVEGSIGAREVVVETGTWSDFVFESNYELRTLEEVEEHIHEKGHLPEIPNAKEVSENGISLGEMNVKLLQKIEELTLYLIEEHKTNLQLQTEVGQLKKKIEQLETDN